MWLRLRLSVTQTKITQCDWVKFVIIDHFCPLPPPHPPPHYSHFRLIFVPLPPKQPEESKFWKNEKSIRKYVTHAYQKSWSYDVCFLEYGVRQIFYHFGTFFALLPHYRPQKLKSEDHVKKLEILSFYTCVPYMKIIYNVWFLRYKAWHSFLSFLAFFFSLWPSSQPKKLKFWKNEKNDLRYNFTQVYQKS